MIIAHDVRAAVRAAYCAPAFLPFALLRRPRIRYFLLIDILLLAVVPALAFALTVMLALFIGVTRVEKNREMNFAAETAMVAAPSPALGVSAGSDG